MAEAIADVDTTLLRRATYGYWEPYWPTVPHDSPDGSYAAFINETPKYVFSTTLDNVTWGAFDNATLIKANLAEEIGNFKNQPGKTISVQGSPTLDNSLLQHDLLDELTLFVHNVVAYKGEHLFKDGNLKRLSLIDAKPTQTGVIIATYQPRK